MAQLNMAVFHASLQPLPWTAHARIDPASIGFRMNTTAGLSPSGP
jgi:hypothetical protein